jgi:hypothetical protein
MNTSTKAERLEHANKLIQIISSHGRRFFYSERHKRVASLEMDRQGRIYLIDDHTGQRVFTGRTKCESDWRGFSHGGTLRFLIEDLRDYIARGSMLRRTIIASPYWAYSPEAAQATQTEAFELPMFRPVSECATQASAKPKTQ